MMKENRFYNIYALIVFIAIICGTWFIIELILWWVSSTRPFDLVSCISWAISWFMMFLFSLKKFKLQYEKNKKIVIESELKRKFRDNITKNVNDRLN